MRKSLGTLTCTLALALLGACDGSTNSKGGGGGDGGSDLRLANIEYGRLVDIYAYRRVNAANGQRRDLTNRVPTLVAKDVVIDPRIETQSLFDPVGEEDPNADFQFRTFDVATGHEELLILWDDRNLDEQPRFASALSRAQSGLVPVAAAYSGQNTTIQPIPVVPRSAALKLKFTRTINVDRSFFAANPAALQVLEIVDDPQTVIPARAFRALPYRVLVQDDVVVLDPSLVGGEVASGAQTTTGLPISRDNVTANIRIAIPTQVVGAGLGVKADQVAQLNGNDRSGLPSVIRDFRTGNASDGRVGSLVDTDRPLLVADVPMGITAIDVDNRVLTVNKRGAKVAVRGNVPFVSGPLAITGFPLPMGPSQVPTVVPLRSGDFIEQVVATPGGRVRVRAEIVMNLDVSNTGTLTSNPNLGRAADGSDGGDAETVRVRVASLSVTGLDGSTTSFTANTNPLGADCTVRVHYYENVPYSAGGLAVTDAQRRAEFIIFDPATPRIDPVTRQPILLGTRISPLAALSLRFSEPMDFDSIDTAGNVFIANRFLPDRTTDPGPVFDIVDMVNEAKAAALSMVGTLREDFQQDGTVVRLNLPMGHTHEATVAEQHWLHVLSNDAGPRDLSGNPFDVYDRRVGADQRRAFSQSYTLEPTAAENLVGVRVLRFANVDEDGTKPGSPDFFGQFDLRDGQLFAAPVTRFAKIADGTNLGTIVRGPNGECFDPGQQGGPGPPPIPFRAASHMTWGPLYTTPTMVASTGPAPPPNPFQPPTSNYIYGGIGGPHNPRGVREQVTYREDDFGLGYHDADAMMIDVEQMYWSPWTNQTVTYDEFDRATLRMGHSIKRPDLMARFFAAPGLISCVLDCASLFSGLSTSFDANPVNGVMVDVVTDKAYTVDPADSFRGTTLNVFTPYPRFTRTFTWRDSRLVSWDMANDTAIGLGGATDPTQANIPPKDTTAHVSSPWETDVFPQGWTPGPPPVQATIPTVSGYMNLDPGDFIGNRTRDHDPIALPLLLEFRLWPHARGSNTTRSGNRMQIAFVGLNGHQHPNWGYFNLGPVPPGGPAPMTVPHWNRHHNDPRTCGGLQYPSFTVLSHGWVDGIGNETRVDPASEIIARGTTIFDAGSTDATYGLTPVQPFNDHLYWAQADFVRRVSMCTFGFFDTLRPNRQALVREELSLPWPGLSTPGGIPDFSAQDRRRIVDMVAIMDPPLDKQPTGTAVQLEVRGAETITRATDLWNRAVENRALQRNNLLNPEYACEAYRHAMANPGSSDPPQPTPGPRVPATGLTPYVDLEDIDRLRNPITQLLPRFLNFRLVFENDINASAPKRPALKSMSLVYRVKVPN